MDSYENLSKVVFDFNYDIEALDLSLPINLYEDNELLSSSISSEISGNELIANFSATNLYNSHSYSLIIPSNMIAIKDESSVTNSEISLQFEGQGYHMFGYKSVLPRPGSSSLLEEIQVTFDFPEGYGFVYVDDDTTYPMSVYKGDVVETNLLGTITHDGMTSDSKGLIFHPDFDWNAGESYTFVIDEDVVKAYEIGATRPTYLKDYKSQRIEFVGKTPSVDEIPKVTFVEQTEIPELSND